MPSPLALLARCASPAALALLAGCSGGSADDERALEATTSTTGVATTALREGVELARVAASPREETPSALPPRHLDAALHPTALVPREQIVSGGPPPDGIPSIDAPRFLRVGEVDFLADDEPVIVLVHGGETRVYPVQILIWHELVNDTVAGAPLTVAYCPLCNSAVAYDRRVEGRVLEFGTSGSLYQSALVMYDRQTHTLWTHFDGRAVVGPLAGAQLGLVPVSTVGWGTIRQRTPDALVLSRATGRTKPYGTNPYVGYEQGGAPIEGFFTGDLDLRRLAMSRVVGVRGGGDAVGVGAEAAAARGVVDVELAGRRVTVWHAPGVSSAIDGELTTRARDVGAVGVFVPEVDGRPLRFSRQGEEFVDAETASTWSILGEASAGPLSGRRLEPVEHVDTFWFAWSVYQPGARLVD
ncbi:MAG: DUF3179 domain-containing protein [Acidimicrobiales bacterium]